MPRDAVSRTANVGTVGKNGLTHKLYCATTPFSMLVNNRLTRTVRNSTVLWVGMTLHAYEYKKQIAKFVRV